MSPPSGALLLLIAYGAGLSTGLLRFSDPRLVAVLLVAAIAVLRHRIVATVPLAALLGLLGAQHELSARPSRCVERLPLGEQRYRVELIDPGTGTGRILLTTRCTGSVMARWPANVAVGAGERAEVTARWLPRAGPLGFTSGMLLVRRVDARLGGGTLLGTFRQRIAIATDALYGDRAPMVEALVVGWRGELPADVRAHFSAAGLVHLLAISGFHVGLLAGWVLLLLRLARLPRHGAAAGAAVAAVGYALFLGWPAPAARAAILAVLLAACQWRQRQVAPSALLALSALGVLVSDPAALVSVGAWLSVLALAGLTMATRWSDRAIAPHAMVQSLAGSIGAMLATAPVTAAVFGQVAPIGILLNLVAVPVAAALVPALLASLLLHAVFPATAAAMAAAGGVLLELLVAVARLGAAAPGAGVVGTSGLRAALPWLLAATLVAWAIAGRATAREAGRRLAWSGVAALWLTLLLGVGRSPSLGDGRLSLVFADVGQGDAALIRTPGGHWVVVDAGPADERWDAGERVVLPLLRRFGAARIEVLLVSHAHRDHVGGAAAVTAGIPVGLALEPGEPFAESRYHAWLELLAQRGIRWRTVTAGEGWTLDGVTFRVLHPLRGWPRAGEDLNEDSAILEVRWGAFRAVLMGDAGEVAEELLAGTLGTADLLKVGHHGSRTASSSAFLAELRPRAAVVSVGRNRYGHPTPEALGRLAAAGARIWRTDREGQITVESDGHDFTVRGGSGLATFTAGRRAGPRRRRAPQFPGHHPRALHPRPGTSASRRHRRADQPSL